MTDTSAPVPFAGQSDAQFTTDAVVPRHERRFFDFWLIDLVSHWAEWRHPRCVAPQALSESLCCLARDCMRKAETWGWVIEHGPDGYRVVDYHCPVRVHLVKPANRVGTVAEEEIPGQLVMAEVV